MHTDCGRRVAADLPEGGLAAASTEVRDFSMVVMPALAMEMVCCSMACRRYPSLVITIQMSKYIVGVWCMCRWFQGSVCLYAFCKCQACTTRRQGYCRQQCLKTPATNFSATQRSLIETAAQEGAEIIGTPCESHVDPKHVWNWYK